MIVKLDNNVKVDIATLVSPKSIDKCHFFLFFFFFEALSLMATLHLLDFVCPGDFACLNGGTCLDGRCYCADEYSGVYCEYGEAILLHLVSYFFITSLSLNVNGNLTIHHIFFRL